MFERPLRTIVCGTRFGEHYLAALQKHPDNMVVIGIFGRGSARSRALAEHFAVPLYTDLDDIPLDAIDAACVVVRSGTFAGQGTKIAQFFLKNGVSVLQEHPVHPGEVVRLKRAAKETGAIYHLNSFYPHLDAGRCLIDFTRETVQASGSEPSFVEMTTSLQLLFSSLDIVGRALGHFDDFEVSAALNKGPNAGPFALFTGQIANTPLYLTLQNYLDPRDPDHHSLVMHKLNIGWPQGTVQMTNSFGPVVWTQSLFAPDYDRDDREASYLLHPSTHEDSHYFNLPTALPLGDPMGKSVAEVVTDAFPKALNRAFTDFSDEVTGAAVSPWQSDSYLLGLGQAWLAIMRALGAPETRNLTPPRRPNPDPVAFASRIE